MTFNQLKEKNPMPVFDGRIEMDEQHKYKIDGIDLPGSVTSFLDQFFDPFDPITMANRCARTTNPKSKYYGMTADQVRKQWDDARDAGTNMHAVIEQFYNDGTTVDVDDEKEEFHEEFRQFLKFDREFKKQYPRMEIWRTELLMGDLAYAIAGTADAIYYDREFKGYTIVDWKRTADLPTDKSMLLKKNKRCKFPLGKLADAKFFKYSIQLNVYRYIFERKTGHKVNNMFIVQLHPSLAGPIMTEVDDYQDLVAHMFTLRQLRLAQMELSRLQQLLDETSRVTSRTDNRLEYATDPLQNEPSSDDPDTVTSEKKKKRKITASL